MLRHVVGVGWEELSQRYVKLLNRDYSTLLNSLRDEYEFYATGADVRAAEIRANLLEHLGKVFEVPPHISEANYRDLTDWAEVRYQEVNQYLSEIAKGTPPEDARENLPNCTLTQMIGTFTFEAMKNFLAKRLCTRAQLPIRRAAKEMRKQVASQFPWMARHLNIQCTDFGICPEQRPDGCQLLVENGGNIWREEQAARLLRESVKAYKSKP